MAMMKFIFIILFAITPGFVHMVTASTGTATEFPGSSPALAMSNSDPIGTAINIGLVVLLILTAVLGCFRLYRFWKENREAAREEAREKELWE